MRSGARAGRVLSAVALAVGLTLGSGGCRTSTDDVHRWADTVQGPKKLVAVLTHSKYATDLRVEAAMTLIRMKPRRGKRIGIQGDDEHTGLVDALAELVPKERAKIVAEMVPRLVAEMKKPPPKAQAGQPPPPDRLDATAAAETALSQRLCQLKRNRQERWRDAAESL